MSAMLAETEIEATPNQISMSDTDVLDLIRGLRGSHYNGAANFIAKQMKDKYGPVDPDNPKDVLFLIRDEDADNVLSKLEELGHEITAGKYQEENLPTPITRKKAIRSTDGKPKATPRECTCGCGGTTKGGKFLPGHDARFKGALLKRVEDGDEAAVDELLQHPTLIDPAKVRERFGTGPAKREAAEAKKREKLAALREKSKAESADAVETA